MPIALNHLLEETYMAKKNYAIYNHAKVQMIGFISEIFDESSQKVPSFSKTISDKSKVAKSRIAVNLYGQDDADYWNLEAWASSFSSHNHDILLQFAKKGAKVFVEGTPKLNKDKDDKNKYYPSIVVDKIMFLSNVSDDDKTETTKEAPKAARFTEPKSEAKPTPSAKTSDSFDSIMDEADDFFRNFQL